MNHPRQFKWQGFTIFYSLFTLFTLAYVQSNPIVLKDNTPANNIIYSLKKSNLEASLFNSKESKYFAINEKFQLVTKRIVDRDKLCQESGLCCLNDNSGLAPTVLASFQRLCFPYSVQNRFSDFVLPSVCTFNLSISIPLSEISVPDIQIITIVVCEENDHTPKFKHTSTDRDSTLNYKLSRTHQPTFIHNLSELTPINHRIRLPLADDLDAYPFNVQKYRIEDESSNSFGSSRRNDDDWSASATFGLKVAGNSKSPSQPSAMTMLSPFDSDRPIDSDDEQSLAKITSLELELLKPLDREVKDAYNFRILAIDGGSTPHTGTLVVQIRVTDSNDHKPQFDKALYEIEVEEGETDQFRLQMSATDRDVGENARIRYGWPKGSEWIETANSQADLDNFSNRPPGFWFNLDKDKGMLTLRRPLDYEVQRKHVFQVIAYNPTQFVKQLKLDETHHGSMTATTKVIVKVLNKNDEPPLIQIDYVGNGNQTAKYVTENSPSSYFIAFITASDPDFSNLDSSSTNNPSQNSFYPPLPSSSLYKTHFVQSNFDNFDMIQSDMSPSVDCQLESYQNVYSLTRFDDFPKSANPSAIRYVLQTNASLDREKSARNDILITCRDSGLTPQTSTATAVVIIQDENDCYPQVKVHSLALSPPPFAPSTFSQHQQLAAVKPWSPSELTSWIDNYESHDLVSSAIFMAYFANISVYTVALAENQPPGTPFVQLEAVDLDAADNGQVRFDIPEGNLVFNRSSYFNSELYPNVLKFANNPKIFHYFGINRTLGTLFTKTDIDREAGDVLMEQMYVVVEVKDLGKSIRLSTFVLLDIRILDENDNPPYFAQSKFEFSILENLKAPFTLGEIGVYDRDLNPSPLTPESEYYHSMELSSNRLDSMHNLPMPSSHRYSSTKSQFSQRLQLRIDPGHGRRDLPFVLYQDSNGKYMLNATRSLDREVEEAFQFGILATDNPTAWNGAYSHARNGHNPIPLYNKRLHASSHTATALVVINVVDVNDNHPEIIFPNPSTSNSTVHRLSYLVSPGYEIVSVNANDRDAGKSNGKLQFELEAKPDVNQLFTIDRNLGMLRTARTLTLDDLGEHRIQVIVRDEGQPPLETRLFLRLVVDNSKPIWPYVSRKIETAANTALAASNEYGDSGVANQAIYGSNTYHSGLFQFGSKNATNSNIILIVIVLLILVLLCIIVGLCLYLQQKKNFLTFMPDVCKIFRPKEATIQNKNSKTQPHAYGELCPNGIQTLNHPHHHHHHQQQQQQHYHHKHSYLQEKVSFATNSTSPMNNQHNKCLDSHPMPYPIHHRPNCSVDYSNSKLHASLTKPGSAEFLDSTNGIGYSNNQTLMNLSKYHQQQQQHQQQDQALAAGMTSSCSMNLLDPTSSIGPFDKFKTHKMAFNRPETTMSVNLSKSTERAAEYPSNKWTNYHFVYNKTNNGNRLMSENYHIFERPDLINTYNVGHLPEHSNNTEPFYYGKDSIPSNMWKFGFRPIKESATMSIYQPGPLSEGQIMNQSNYDLVKNNFLSPTQRSCLMSNGIRPFSKHPWSNYSNTAHTITGGLGLWKSDPSLNQSVGDLSTNQIFLSGDDGHFYDKIGMLPSSSLAPTGIDHYGIRNGTQTMQPLKRSRSSKHQSKLNSIYHRYYHSRTSDSARPDDVSPTKQPNTMKGESDLVKPLLVQTLSVDTNKLQTNNNRIEEQSNGTADSKHYAVSFPAIQSSFV